MKALNSNFQMKLTVAILAIAICVIVALAASAAVAPGDSTGNEGVTSGKVTAVDYATEVTYIVKAYDGKVAVFNYSELAGDDFGCEASATNSEAAVSGNSVERRRAAKNDKVNYHGQQISRHAASTTATPIAVYETFVSSLPEADRQALSRGIPAASDEALQKIIEDLTS